MKELLEKNEKPMLEAFVKFKTNGKSVITLMTMHTTSLIVDGEGVVNFTIKFKEHIQTQWKFKEFKQAMDKFDHFMNLFV